MSANFFDALGECTQKVNSYLAQPKYKERFKPDYLQEAIFAYLERSGKRLRPSVLLWSCGAVGGDESAALPAAVGIELFHTWTLVHDDLIDNDSSRRGGPTAHIMGSHYASQSLGYDQDSADEFGRNLAILTGDCQHGWNVSLFCECAKSKKVESEVILTVLNILETDVVNTLIEGEMLDVQFSKMSIEKLSKDRIISMLWAKTGALYEFAARAGAMIGLNTSDVNHPQVAALAKFASDCGTAFQLQDDILGLVGKEEKLGKPIGSDIREGKKTLLVYHALTESNQKDKEFLLTVLGNRDASESDVLKATKFILALGSLEYTSDLAMEYVESALEQLSIIEDSEYKSLLIAWADFMIHRTW